MTTTNRASARSSRICRCSAGTAAARASRAWGLIVTEVHQVQDCLRDLCLSTPTDAISAARDAIAPAPLPLRHTPHASADVSVAPAAIRASVKASRKSVAGAGVVHQSLEKAFLKGHVERLAGSRMISARSRTRQRRDVHDGRGQLAGGAARLSRELSHCRCARSSRPATATAAAQLSASASSERPFSPSAVVVTSPRPGQ